VSLADLSGFDRIQRKLARLQNFDPRPLLDLWGAAILEDNRAGVLSGTDKDGNPMEPVKYRSGQGKPTRFRRRNFGAIAGDFKGFGPHASGLHGNLTTDQYKKLSGPPLAPRRDQSRVIANLKLIEPYQQGTAWYVEAHWLDVVSINGVPFLPAHFGGKDTGRNHATKLPRRDLAGVRPAGRQKIVQLTRQYVMALLNGSP
jgi:hypothetical protein